MLTEQLKSEILAIKANNPNMDFVDAFVEKFEDFVTENMKHSKFLDALEAVDERCLFLRLFLDYHGQVCNGGHAQYWDNGYACSSMLDHGCMSRKDTDDCDIHNTMIELFKKYMPNMNITKKALEIMEDFQNHLEYEDCTCCDGTGTCHDEEECEDCGGTGYLDDDSICDNCNGRGYFETDDTCYECHGEGHLDYITYNEGYKDLDSMYYKIDDELLEVLDNVCEFWLTGTSDGVRNEFDEEEPSEMKTTKKPKVKLVGTDGNAFCLIGRVTEALRDAGLRDQIAEFQKEAMSGDYDHLLVTCMKYAEVY